MIASLFRPQHLPGYYYYATRYTRPHRRVAHLLKYWLSFPLALYASGHPVEFPLFLLQYLLAWLIFQNIYDVFCRLNDECSTGGEQNPTRRSLPGIPRWRHYLVAKTLLTLAFGSGLSLLIPAAEMASVTALICITSIAFHLHNHLPDYYRPLTYFALYTCKGLLCATMMEDFPQGISVSYWAFVLLFSASYLPTYILKKQGSTSRKARPIYFKNVSFLLLSLTASWLFILPWAWVNFWTGLEYLANKSITAQKT